MARYSVGVRKSIGPNPYQACPELTARTSGRHPYASAFSFFEDYSSTSQMGVLLRMADARMRLKEMMAVESAVAEYEQLLSKLPNRLERIQAQHRLNMQYLVEFGVRADQRQMFRTVMAEVSKRGEKTLFEAAELIRAKCSATLRSTPTNSPPSL